MKAFPMSNLFSTSHTRAARAMDARIDAIRDGGDGADAWLDGHLASCPRCAEAWRVRSAMVATLRALEPESPGEGFAKRVLAEARARKTLGVARNEVSTAKAQPVSWFPRLIAGAAVAAACAVGVVLVRAQTQPAAPGVVALGGGTAIEAIGAPHFVVRAPGVGAAQVRSVVTEMVKQKGGRYTDAGGAIVAELPYRSLVAFTKDLARVGPYKMSKTPDADNLTAASPTVTLRFELE